MKFNFFADTFQLLNEKVLFIGHISLTLSSILDGLSQKVCRSNFWPCFLHKHAHET